MIIGHIVHIVFTVFTDLHHFPRGADLQEDLNYLYMFPKYTGSSSGPQGVGMKPCACSGL